MRATSATSPDAAEGDADVRRAGHRDRSRATGGRRATPPRRRAARAPRLDATRCSAAFTTSSQSRRVGAGGDQRHVRGPRRDLRRLPRLRRGVPPLRARARRHAGRAARPRPPDRPHRPGRPRGRHGRTRSSCCPTTARPRGRRSCSAPVRHSPELVARLCGEAASGDGDAEAGRTESTAWLRQARSSPTTTSKPAADDVPDRARLRQPRPDLAARRAPAADPGGDRRSLPGPDPGPARLAGGRVRAGAFARRRLVGARRRWVTQPDDRRRRRRRPAGAVRSGSRSVRSPRSTATRPSPT